MRLAQAFATDGRVTRELTVGDICVEDAYTVEHDTALDDVLDYMSNHRIGSALVTRHGKLVGIFTATDACREFAEYLRRTYPDLVA